MNGIVWRWEERDLGFRFRDGAGRRAAEYYQAGKVVEFYTVPRSLRKLNKARTDELVALATRPETFHAVSNPWRNYELDWDWIDTEDGICLNWAGCLDKEQVDRREDEGVQRGMELVAELLERPESVPIMWSLKASGQRFLIWTGFGARGGSPIRGMRCSRARSGMACGACGLTSHAGISRQLKERHWRISGSASSRTFSERRNRSIQPSPL